MRIVYLSESPIPSRLANAVHVMKMAAALARRGHAVTLVASRGETTGGEEGDLFAHYGVPAAFELVRIPFPAFRGGSLGFAARAAREALRRRPELIYGRYLRGLALAALACRRLVVETHQPVDRMDALSRTAFRCLERSGRVRRLVVISEALRGLIAPQTRLGEIMVAHDAVDLPSAPPPLPAAGPFVAGYFGSLYPGRGVEVVVELARRLPEMRFRVVGGRPEDLARHQTGGLPANLEFLGFVPPGRVAGLMQACSALLMPYQRRVTIQGQGDTSAWMSPLKMFEYLAAGRPVVSSDLPVLGEVLRAGDNALLVPPEDPEAWRAALVRLRDDPALAARLAARGRELVAARHTWDRRAAQVLAGLE